MDGVRTIISHGVLIHAGESLALTQQDERIVSCMLQAYPQVVSRNTIYDAICSAYIHEDDYPEPKVVDVYLSKLRKGLGALGIYIDTLQSRGYTLRFADVASHEAIRLDNENHRAARAGLKAIAGAGDDERIRELAGQGIGETQIAIRMHMPYRLINARLKAMGLLRSQQIKQEVA